MMFLFVINLTADENFYKNYSESERLVIAGAYLAVSEQYSSLGETDKARDFRGMAEEIFPGIKAGDLTGEQAPAPVEAEQVQTSVPTRPSGKEAGAVQYFFSKMLRAVFSENKTDIESLLSTRLYLPGYDNGLKKSEVMHYVSWAFDTYELDQTDPGLIYDTSRLFIRADGSSWVASIDLTEKGAELFAQEIGFYGNRHMFYFREFREGWRLIAVNAASLDS